MKKRHENLAKNRSKKKAFFNGTVLTFIAGIASSAIAFAVVWDLEQKKIIREFAHEGGKIAGLVERQATKDLQILESIISFYDASEEVTREEFRQFTSNYLAANPILQTARDREKAIAIMPSVSFPKSKLAKKSFWVLLLVYQNNVSISSIGDLRRHLQGFIWGVVSIEDMVAEALNYYRPQGIDFVLFNKLVSSPEQVLYSSNPSLISEILSPKKYTIQQQYEINISEQQWLIVLQPTTQYLWEQTTWHPLGIYRQAGEPLTKQSQILMPGIDGYETCRRLKKDPEIEDIPVIFMTALTSTENKVKGFELGAVDYVTTPIQPEEVLARIKLHLHLRHMSNVQSKQNEMPIAEIEQRKQMQYRLSQINQTLETEISDRL